MARGAALFDLHVAAYQIFLDDRQVRLLHGFAKAF
jgi:hypothetical protein